MNKIDVLTYCTIFFGLLTLTSIITSVVLTGISEYPWAEHIFIITIFSCFITCILCSIGPKDRDINKN